MSWSCLKSENPFICPTTDVLFINCAFKQTQTIPGAHAEPVGISAFTHKPKLCLVSHLHACFWNGPNHWEKRLMNYFFFFHKLHAPVAQYLIDIAHQQQMMEQACCLSWRQWAGHQKQHSLTCSFLYKHTFVDRPNFLHSVLHILYPIFVINKNRNCISVIYVCW